MELRSLQVGCGGTEAWAGVTFRGPTALVPVACPSAMIHIDFFNPMARHSLWHLPLSLVAQAVKRTVLPRLPHWTS
jgi:hypothetical protein